MATKTMTVDDILDGIAALTVMELAELKDKFEERFGVTAMAAAPMAMPAAAGGEAAPAAEEQTEFTVVLAGAGAKKIQVIKAVREVTSLGLKEAKELVDGAPNTVKEGATREEAEAIKQKLEEQGATVELK